MKFTNPTARRALCHGRPTMLLKKMQIRNRNGNFIVIRDYTNSSNLIKTINPRTLLSPRFIIQISVHSINDKEN